MKRKSMQLHKWKPINAKQVQGFMGHCGYYCRFIYNYATIARPLYALLVNFEWTKKCNEAFEKLKKALVNVPILRTPDWNNPSMFTLTLPSLPLDACQPNQGSKIWTF